MKLSAVIPTLDEEENIEIVLENVSKYVNEIIIVDGYSVDKTVELAKKFGVKVIYDDRGKGSAIRKGIMHATGDILVLFDCDLSHRPEEIENAIKFVKEGYDICMPSRILGKSYDFTKMRKFLNIALANFINFMWGTNYSDVCYGFRVAKKDALKKLDLESDGFEIETEISIKAAKRKLKIIEIPSIERKRKYGKGKFRLLPHGLRILGLVFREMFV